MTHLFTIVAIISFTIIDSGLVLKKIEGAPLSEPLVAMLIGILVGPELLDLWHVKDLEVKFKVMELITAFTISMSLMATGLRLPPKYYKNSKNTQIPLILIGMFLMSLFSGLLIFLVFDLPFLLSLLIGAILSPTDPVIASTIVSGPIAEKYLPDRIRHTISGESGANDGIGFPFVLLPLLLITKPDSALSDWFLRVVLWENVLAIIVAFVIGFGLGRGMELAKKSGRITAKAFLGLSVSLAFFIFTFFQFIINL